MKTRSVVLIFLLVIISCAGILYTSKAPETRPLDNTTESAIPETPANTLPEFRSSDTVELRKAAYAACSNLDNSVIDSVGLVLFEECGKNCLGGCPNSGPDYCFYGVLEDRTKCVFYIPSRINAQGDERFESLEQTFNSFKPNESVKINGTLNVYTNYYCGGGEIKPECEYLLLK